jgi:polysaccharide pyruvyl transferase WcaK-like protein
MDKIEKFNLSKDLRKSFKSFKCISVRDNNSSEIVACLTGNRPLIHLDPVLIYDFSEKVNKCRINISDYIVIYTYVDRIKDKAEIQAIRSFAQKHNKRLISIFCWYTWCDEMLVPNTPFDVLAYFKNSDYIITDTFHGTIFSIINGKKFGTIVRNSNKQKITSLLKNFSLEDRIISNLSNLDDILTASISYDKANKLINEEKSRSIEYLKSALKASANKSYTCDNADVRT